MAERTMTRIHRKLDEYPPEAREMVDKLLADPQMTYTDIADGVNGSIKFIYKTDAVKED